jgi:hypothetical protein
LFLAQQTPSPWARVSSFTRFLYHTQRRTTVGRTPLDEWSARRRQHTTLTTDKHPCPRRDSTHNLRRRAAADLRLRPRGHWGRWRRYYAPVLIPWYCRSSIKWKMKNKVFCLLNDHTATQLSCREITMIQ